MNLQTWFEQTLSAPNPGTAMRSLVLDLAKQGHSRAAICDALEKLVLSLREHAGNEAAEDVVLDTLDALTGFCHPSARLLADEVR
jgi:hypothetical protein